MNNRVQLLNRIGRRGIKLVEAHRFFRRLICLRPHGQLWFVKIFSLSYYFSILCGVSRAYQLTAQHVFVRIIPDPAATYIFYAFSAIVAFFMSQM